MTFTKSAALALTIALAVSPLAMAKDHGKGKGHGKKKQRSSIEQQFIRYDTNRDGFVTRIEFPADFAFFDLADRNRDGRLSRAEATSAMGRGRELEHVARGLDTNNDGVISRNEWRGNTNSFNQLDRNRDGVISRADRKQ